MPVTWNDCSAAVGSGATMSSSEATERSEPEVVSVCTFQ
jgi:hypothetical protein